jgi:hypothetical protein
MLPLEKMATQPKMIFVGTVVSTEPRWVNDSLIMTKVTFELNSQVAGDFPEGKTLEFEQFGGTVGDESIEHSHMPLWEIGESYLVFAEDPALSGAVPTYGGECGFYRLIADESDGSVLYPVDTHDRPISAIRDGMFKLARPARRIDKGVASLASAEPYQAGLPKSLNGEMSTIATFENTIEVLDLDRIVQVIRSIRGDEGGPMEGLPAGGTLHRTQGGLAGLTLCWCGWHSIFLVFEQVPSSWANYDNNEWCMARINKYLDLTRYQNDDGSWGVNGDDELTGFPTNADLRTIYGLNDEGNWAIQWGSSLAMCVGTSGSGCDRITEADIHFNSAYRWRYNFEDAFQGANDVFFYDPIMLHEMGHALALETGSCNEDYQFDRNTIMCAGTNDIVEYGKGLHRRDAKALRISYDDNHDIADTINRTDMGVESWYMDGDIENGSVDQSNVQPGDIINMRDLVVENMSTWNVSSVKIRCFLSTNMTISEYDYQSPTIYTWGTFSEDADSRADYEWKIPNDIPPGQYYVGVMVTYNGTNYPQDSIGGNNTTFFPEILTVNEADPPSLVPIPIDWDWVFSNTFYANSNNGSGESQFRPFCPGDGRMGPSQFFEAVAPIGGKMRVAPTGYSYGEGFGQEPGPAIAIYLSENGLPGELLQVFCGTSTSNPAIIDIQPNQPYIIQVGALEGSPAFTGWMNAAIETDIPVGSAPQFPIQWSEGQNETLGEEFAPPIDLPCSSSSSMGRWYAYTAPCDGTIKVSTCNQVTNFPSVVSIHRPEQGLPAVDCGTWDDMRCDGSFGANATTEMLAGQKILIRIATADPGENMMFQMDVEMAPEEDSLFKCDNAPPMKPGENFITGNGTSNAFIPICDEPWEIPAFGTWRSLNGLDNVLVTVTTCEDLGGQTGSEVSVTLYAGDCSSLVPLACNNFGCSDGGAQLAVTSPTDLKIHFQTTSNAMVIVRIEELPCDGDLNRDGIVDGVDLAELLGSWGQSDVPADIDGSGEVDGADLATILGNWGFCQ